MVGLLLSSTHMLPNINYIISLSSSYIVKRASSRPPVNHIGTLEFDKIDEIVEAGYKYALPLVREWAKENGYG